MSTIPGSALPIPWGARDQKLVKPTVILAAILRSLGAPSERRCLDRTVPAEPGRRPAVPTFFRSTYVTSSERAAPGSATTAACDERAVM
jgi:hypothetical protein